MRNYLNDMPGTFFLGNTNPILTTTSNEELTKKDMPGTFFLCNTNPILTTISNEELEGKKDMQGMFFLDNHFMSY